MRGGDAYPLPKDSGVARNDDATAQNPWFWSVRVGLQYGALAVEQDKYSMPAGCRVVQCTMRLTAIIERDGPSHIAYCAELPGANGQGKSREDCPALERPLYERRPSCFQVPGHSSIIRPELPTGLEIAEGFDS